MELFEKTCQGEQTAIESVVDTIEPLIPFKHSVTRLGGRTYRSSRASGRSARDRFIQCARRLGRGARKGQRPEVEKVRREHTVLADHRRWPSCRGR